MGLLDSLFGGSNEQPTQTTTQILSPQQKQILNWAMPGIRSFAKAGPPKRYPGETVAGFTGPQTQGQQMALGAASGPQTSLAGSATDANQFLLSDIWNPSTNPYLQDAIDAAVRPITQNYQQVVRPAIRDNFAQAGQVFGGSRRNIAEGNAADAYMRDVGDTASKLVQDQYANNLGAYVKALGLIPQTQGAAVTPAITTSGVGDVQQALDQARLSERVSNWNYDQLAPFLQSKELLSLLAGIPGGSVQTTANLPSGGSTGSSILGGAATGASLGSVIPGIGTGLGAGIGALLSFL